MNKDSTSIIFVRIRVPKGIVYKRGILLGLSTAKKMIAQFFPDSRAK